MIAWLLVAHIAVLGYWLGSELVINSTYRYVCYADDMPMAERSRLMDHVMHVDQHVRYALVLQASLGLMLAANAGFVPGGRPVLMAAGLFGLAWLFFVEAVHRTRKRPVGQVLGAIDRASRYGLMALLVAVALGLIGGSWFAPGWLRWKLAAFAGVIACGVGIRFALIAHFRTWAQMQSSGVTPERNAIIRGTYKRATGILILLWVFIAIMVWLSVAKPS